MPWMEMSPMTQRMRLVAEFLTGDYTVSELARRWSVSRPTVYKWIERHCEEGPRGLQDRSHLAHNCPHRLNEEMEQRIVACRNVYMKWGAKKLLKKLVERYPDESGWPALSTIGDVLKRRGLVVARKVRRRVEPYTQPFGESDAPNRIWCADFKGWFRLGNGVRCDPLTTAIVDICCAVRRWVGRTTSPCGRSLKLSCESMDFRSLCAQTMARRLPRVRFAG